MDSSKTTVDLSGLNESVMGTYTPGTISLGSSIDTISTITTGTVTAPWYTNTLNNSWVTTSITDNTGSLGQAAVLEANGKMSLNGDKADIEINGVSLMNILKTLEERLNILIPNPNLETEWDQLRELGEQYRALEADLKEKSKMWNTLKK